MQIILLERIQGLGQMGDEVKVAPGYARNFLLPRKKALRANATNRNHFQAQRAQLEADNLKKKGDAEHVAGKLNGLSVILTRQAGEAGQLFGSVTARDIAAAVTAAGFTVQREQIHIEQSIKIIGVYPIAVQLHPEVRASITANVARSEEEANNQAAAVAAGRALGAMPPASQEDGDSTPTGNEYRAKRGGGGKKGKPRKDAAEDSADSAPVAEAETAA